MTSELLRKDPPDRSSSLKISFVQVGTTFQNNDSLEEAGKLDFHQDYLLGVFKIVLYLIN